MGKDFKRREYYLTFEKLNKFQEEEPEEEPKEEPKGKSKFKKLVNAIYDFLNIDGVEIKICQCDINIDIQDLDRQIIVEVYITTSGKAVIEFNDFANLGFTGKYTIGEVEFYLLSQNEAYKDRICTDQGIRFNFDTAFEGL